MKRFMLSSLFAIATAAAWLLIRTRNPAKRTVFAQDAAAKLRDAWADHHTTA